MATNRFNGLDGLLMNQGYMSDRNKSPKRVGQQMLFQNQMLINGNNINKLNSGRDASPNKIITKNKPLVSNNNVNQQFAPYGNPTQPPTNSNNKLQIHMGHQLNSNPNQNISNLNTLQHQFSNFSNNPNSNQFNNNLHNNNNNNWRNTSKSPRSPNDINYHSQIQQQSNTKMCENHLNKKAQYMAESDGEIIYYCETCAAKLAAQKFQVVKLPVGNFAIGNGGGMMINNGYHVGNNSTNTNGYNSSNNNGYTKHNNNLYNNGYNPTPTKPTPLPYRRRQIPSLPQYKNNPVYESIIQFLKQIYSVQQHHYQTHQQLSSIDSHYQHQLLIVDEFYNQLIQILSKMHDDHIADLRAEHRKHSQMKDIYVNQIYENLETIEQIVNDLDENFEPVMTKITNQDIQFFNQALQKNRSNIRFFANQIEQQKDMLAEVTHYKEDRLIQMVNEFQESLVKLWQQPKPQTANKNYIQPGITNNPSNNHKNNNNNNTNGNVNGNGNCNVSVNVNGNNKGQQNINGARQQSNNPPSNNLPNINNLNFNQPNNNNTKPEEQQKLNILQIHQNQPKSALIRDFQGKGACRQIFQDDEDDNLTQQISPKFKNI